MTEQNEQHIHATGMTPGQILRQARESKGWSIGDISEYTRLSVQCIRDLEADEYRHMAAPVYLHGYFRSYARVVSVPEQVVLDAFKSIESNYNYEPSRSPLMPAADDGVPIYKQSGTIKSKKILRWGSAIMVLCLITLIMLWWHDQHSLNNARSNITTSQTSPSVTSSSSKSLTITTPDNATVTAKPASSDTPVTTASAKKTTASPAPAAKAVPAAVHQASTPSASPAKTTATAVPHSSLAPTYTVTPVSNRNAGD